MAETFVQLPADSTGQKLRTESVVVGGVTVLQQVGTLADSAGNLVNVTGNALNVAATGTVAVSNFPTTGDATAANQTALNTLAGAVTETAPATDTASSGLNGRLQRIAQKLTSLIALLPGSLGQKTSAASLAVTVASDQSAVPVSGTFWQATQPVSGTVTATGPLTDTQLRATAVPVSGTVTANAGSGTMAISSTDMGTTASAAYTDGTGAASGSLVSLLKGAYIKLASLVTNLPSSLGAKTGANSLSIVPATDGIFSAVGTIAHVTVTLTRPADTTAYAAKDVVSDSTSAPTVLTFAGAARVTAGSGYIVKAKLLTDQKTNVGTFRLWLFNAAPTAINDNSPFLLLYATAASLLGYIDFPALSTEDPTSSTGAQSIVTAGTIGPFSYVCSGGSTIYGILETTAAFTPASGQNFSVALTFDQN